MRDIPNAIPPEEVAKANESELAPEDLGLDRNTRQRVASWARQKLESLYDQAASGEGREDFGAKLDFAHSMEAEIAGMVGETDSFNQRLLAPRYREGVSIFLNSLIDFIEEKANFGDREKLQTFVSGLHEAMFSFSPNLANQIGLENMLLTTAKATRVSEAQGWFGQNMVGELTYELNWAHEESVGRILNRIKKLELPEQLDVIHQLTTVAADAIAQGEPGYQAHDRIVRMLEIINHESQYPIVRYATENALITIEREEENPSLGVVTFHGNVAGARLPETLNQNLVDESDRLKKQVRIKNGPQGSYKILQISSDAVALFDHSNTPRQFSKVDVSSLPTPTEVNALLVERLKEGAEAKLNRNQFYELFIRTTNLLLEHDKNKRAINSLILAEKWAEVSNQFSKEEWERVFSVMLKRQDAEEGNARKLAELQEKVENANLAASNRFIELVIKKGKEILASLPNPPAILNEYYQNLLRYREEGNEERAFTSAESFARFFQINQEFGTSDKHGLSEAQLHHGLELAEQVQAVRDIHIANWDEYNEARMLQSTGQNPQSEAEILEFVETKERLLEKQKQLQADILRYLQQLDQNLSGKLVTVEARSFDQIENDQNLNPFNGEDREQLALLLQQLHNPALRSLLEQDLGINLTEIPLRSQIHLLRYLSDQNREGFDHLRNVLQRDLAFKNEFLRSFLITAEDSRFGSSIIELADSLSNRPGLGSKVFQTYDQYVGKVSEVARNVLASLQQEFPNSSIDENTIVQSLLTRAKDFMVELETEIKSQLENVEAAVNNFITELSKESPKEQVVRAQFKNISSLLDRENIDLKSFEQSQELILRSLMKGDQKILLFKTLQRMGKLSPIPEIHWRVDRSIEEYDRRLGLDLIKFLQERAEQVGRKQILLEIGPGNGVGKMERAQAALTERYDDFALSDRIYYPIAPILEKLVDYQKLETDLGQSLSEEEKHQLADFLYKILVIAEGQTSQDNFDYDLNFKEVFRGDLNNLRQMMPKLTERLAETDVVPSTISTRDAKGQVTYPYKIRVSEWPEHLQRAKQLLERSVYNYLRDDWKEADYYNFVEAFPANVMIGDISQISRLKSDQVDVELAVRSTVYKKPGEGYSEFLQNLVEKLNNGGVAVDDSVRDNDGYYYRIAEVLEAKRKSGPDTEVLVVLGPGFPGEDKRQDRVPLSMIITKQGSSEELVRKHLLPGYDIVSLEDIASDREYLRTLDETGLTEQKVAAMAAV